MKVVRTTPENQLAVSLEDARAQLRVDPDDTSQDVIISDLIASATADVEKFTGLQLLQASYDIFIRSFPRSLAIPVYPFIKVTGVAFIDADGDMQQVAENDYTVENVGGEAVIRFNLDVSLSNDVTYPVSISVVAGHGADGATTQQQQAAIPKAARRSIMAKITSLYDKREDYYAPNQMKASDLLLVPITRNWPN
jgi:uncharacterized phiE125 gp8 family phage protein